MGAYAAYSQAHRRGKPCACRFSPFCAIAVVVAAAAAALTLAACSETEPSRAEFALNTLCSVTLYDQAKSEVYQDVFNRIREIENRMSAHLAETDVARVNAAAGRAPVQVHDDVFEVIEQAVYFAEFSGGAFDPTVGPLTSLWELSKNNLTI
jgi:thiamine biosynthesis lipoprotein